MQARSKALNKIRQEQRLTSAPPAKSGLPATWRLALLALASASLVFAIYSRSLGFQFILDDHRFTSDPRIQEAGHLWDYFANYVWAQFVGGPPSFYRPIFLVWLRLNFILAGMSPWGWHLLSIAKHLLGAALLGILIWKLLRDWGAALASATLFALHPAQTESVSWTTVPDPLMTAGLCAALLIYLRYAAPVLSVQSPQSKARKKLPRMTVSSPLLLMASAAIYFAEILTKETAIIFPLVIFAVALCMEPTEASGNGSNATGTDLTVRLRKALRHSAPFLGATVLYLLLRLNALGRVAVSTQHLEWKTIVLSCPATLWFYVKVMFWPVKSYSFADPTLIEQFSIGRVLLPSLELAGCAAFAIVLSVFALKKTQGESGERHAAGVRIALVTGLLFLILPLLLTLNLNALNPGDFLHGRYTYLPLVGLMLLGAVGWNLLRSHRIARTCATIGLTAAFAVLTFAQEAQWKDDATVFATAHQLAPHNAPVAQHFADTLVQGALQLENEGRCSEAIPTFDRVIRDHPDDWSAWAGRGVCYVQLDDLPKAEASLHRAADISHNPQVIEHWQQLRTHMGLTNTSSIQ